MGDAEKLVELLSGGGLASFVLILVGLLCLIKLVDGAVEIAKKWRKNGSVEDQRKTCDQKFANDKRRLDDFEKRLDDMQELQKATAFGVSELLGHELHNGNTEQMIDAEKRLKECIFS